MREADLALRSSSGDPARSRGPALLIDWRRRRLVSPRSIPLLASVLILAGCRGWQGDQYLRHRTPSSRAARETSYAFAPPGAAWREVRKAEHVQVAWVNDAAGAVITIHAQCDEQGDSSLEQYTDHMRIDWTGWKVLSQQQERLIDRAALRTVVDAELDGVPRRNEYVVVKRSGCLFDLQYSARPDSFDSARPGFVQVVEGFRFPTESR
ncbi:MAG: hypothetical protein JNK45_04240 [Myxococcales bacterium]|nr:hypothetical protein [Myxococcales bacterium]